MLSVLCMPKHIQYKEYGPLQTSHSQVQKGSKEIQVLYVQDNTTTAYCWSYKQSAGGFIAEESRGKLRLRLEVWY